MKRILFSIILLLNLTSKCFAVTEFVCMINGGAVEDYNTITTWEGAMDDAGNLTDGTCATGDWDAQSGTIADGADVTWNGGTDDGTLIHMTDAGSTGTFLVIGDDSGDIDNLADDDVITDGSNTITVNGSPDSAILVAECYNDDGDLNDRFSLGGNTANATNYLKITVPEGERHNGITGGFTLAPTSNGDAMRPWVDYTQIEWIHLTGWQGADNSAFYGIYWYNNNGQYGTASHLLIHDNDTGANKRPLVFYVDSQNITVDRCIVYNILGHADYAQFWYNRYRGTLNIKNCTFYNASSCGIQGISTSYKPISTNVIVATTGGDCWGANTLGDYNISTDGTAPDAGGNSLINQDLTTQIKFVSIAGSSEDLHLASGSVAIDEGNDLGSPYDYDIDNVLVTGTWDIGADEYVGAAPAARRMFMVN